MLCIYQYSIGYIQTATNLIFQYKYLPAIKPSVGFWPFAPVILAAIMVGLLMLLSLLIPALDQFLCQNLEILGTHHLALGMDHKNIYRYLLGYFSQYIFGCSFLLR